MNIYEARKLQKILYKHSSVDYKRLFTRIIDGKLCYDVIHHLCSYRGTFLKRNVIDRISTNEHTGVETIIYYTKENNIFDSPEGMYLLERIHIDD